MYVIVDIAGQQFKVEKDQKLFVHRLDAKEGDSISFDKILLTDDNGKVSVGTPKILGAEVRAKVLAHMRGEKVKVFKKKRRKGYQKLNGHRQDFSQILIEEISIDGKSVSKKQEVKEPEAKKAETKKPEAKKPETKKIEAESDKLTKIEGIGPKIETLLKEAGIETFKKLAKTKPERISELLIEKGGSTYSKYDPKTWPEQAKLAADEKWDELKKLQEELTGGKAK
jgi:large subunit ribosomal protein L21